MIKLVEENKFMTESDPKSYPGSKNQIVSESGGRLNAYPNEPSIEIIEADQSWGFHEKAEKTNGRLAMIAFIIILTIELTLKGDTIMNKLYNIVANFI